MTAAVMSLCLTAGAVQADAPVASHWGLDEASGTTTVDSVTGATGTLSGAVAFGPGKAGSGLDFSGGTVSAPLAVDTGTSFTVSAWVNLATECTARKCGFTAVSADGERSSRFSLGYLKDRDHLGNWYFEMAEADTDAAPVTATATSAIPAETGVWTHVVGVHDADSGTTYLYESGSLVGSGTINAQWNGTGGLALGAARKAGAQTGFWPGAADEVRFFGRALTHDEVFALHQAEA
ncbi:LamG domain-containing protein [Lentzea cavernae]|uniref:LamG-like jellyroll fold domain-containing protein n=1 Tax=Lentzea cavernae TaxID=2020703 RepID=A0ABQ3MRB9_9PSEU|nr:LamG domain-containing protein [Lentzea cavernae]GHH57220.1 hypothetical protein GCM10017774_76470 [Lentzea cavernae]